MDKYFGENYMHGFAMLFTKDPEKCEEEKV